MVDFILILKALADETRLRIINILLTHDLCVGALANHLNISKAAVSQHLQILRRAGLVKSQKRGYWTHYAVERDALLQLASEIKSRVNQVCTPMAWCQKTISESASRNNKSKDETMYGNCLQKPDHRNLQ